MTEEAPPGLAQGGPSEGPPAAPATSPPPPAAPGLAAEIGFLLAALVLACWPSLVGVASPHDIGTHDQAKQAMVVVDALQGNLAMPYEGTCSRYKAAVSAQPERGCPATKPPLYTWLAAGLGRLFGLDEVTVRMPSVLASVGLGLLVYAFGRRFFDPATGLAAVALFATTQHVAKLSFFARTDMLLSFFVALALWAFVAGRPLLLWIAVGLGALTKGPPSLIPLVAVAVTLAFRRDLAGARALRPGRGLVIVLGILAVWLLPATLFHFRDVADVFRAEGIEQMTRTGKYADAKQQPFWYHVPYFFLKTLPWSILVVPGLVRHARPSAPAFLLVAWLLGGLVLLSIPGAKRPDHLLPLYAPAVVLAASVVVGWLRGAAAAQPYARALEGGVRLWALGAGAFALLAVPAAWLGLVGGEASPPLWVPAAGLLALAPLRLALRSATGPRALFAGALAAQALSTLVYAHLLTAPAKSGDGARVREFAREVARLTGGDVDFYLAHSPPLQFHLQRNVPEIDDGGWAARVASPLPSWVVMAGSAYDAAVSRTEPWGGRRPPQPELRGAPRRERDGDDLVLLRLGGGTPLRETTPAPGAEPEAARELPPGVEAIPDGDAPPGAEEAPAERGAPDEVAL